MTTRSHGLAGSPPILAMGLVVALVTSVAGPARAAGYVREDLVSDLPGAVRTDANLVNAWGIAFPPGGPLWISDNHTGVSTLYRTNSRPVPSPEAPLVVTVAPLPGSTDPASPTGIVFNSTAGFELAPGMPSRFIFATEDGTISGWNSAVDATHSILKVNRSPDAVYKGLALLGGQLFATNFRGNGVDVFNSDWSLAGSFTDPNVPPGFAPFGIQNLGGKLYVTFAKQDDEKKDDVKGAGNGYVDIFDPSTHTFTRLISGGAPDSPLNSPWGLALAPDGFGPATGALLVGNFGDGRINAFSPSTGAFVGPLTDSSDQPIVIDGLWALAFDYDPSEPLHPFLFFTAGPNGEDHGLLGRIDYVQRYMRLHSHG
jgi:uncharacterized protein (TIGR03118 family)